MTSPTGAGERPDIGLYSSIVIAIIGEDSPSFMGIEGVMLKLGFWIYQEIPTDTAGIIFTTTDPTSAKA